MHHMTSWIKSFAVTCDFLIINLASPQSDGAYVQPIMCSRCSLSSYSDVFLIASSAEEASRMMQPPDLRQVTVLTKAEWLRIQDDLNQVNKDKERMREAAKQREALHLQSKEVVKLWSNTIAVSHLNWAFIRFYLLWL